MLRYVVRRILWGAFLLVVVSALTFVIFTVFPSADPAALRAGRQATPELIAQIRHNLGLDKPLYVQYWLFVKGIVLHFDLGYSYQNSVSVKSQIFTRLPVTLSLTAGAFVIWMIVAIPIGVISAIRPRSLLDRATMGGALVAISAPVYFLGLIALFLFSNDIGVVHLLPGAGSYTPLSVSPWRWFTSLLMPWCVLAAAFAAFYARMVRGNLIDTMGEDYIRTARAKGLSRAARRRARHGLRAALTPVVTMAGLDIGILLGGAILTETVFNIPGIGRLRLRLDHQLRPAGDRGHRPLRGVLHHRREHLRGHRVRVPRPAGALLMRAPRDPRPARLLRDARRHRPGGRRRLAHRRPRPHARRRRRVRVGKERHRAHRNGPHATPERDDRPGEVLFEGVDLLSCRRTSSAPCAASASR